MKYLLFSLTLFASFAFIHPDSRSFATAECPPHAIFEVMSNYSLRKCEEKEKAKQSYYQDIPGGVTQVIKKEGKLVLHNFKFDGTYENRPPVSQILKYHEDAAKKAGVEILSRTNRAMYFKAQKEKTVYWIYLTTDDTGDYFLYTIAEPAS
jgi:hypothetical protein